jgi:PAS domain S-box-containing protein
MNASEAARHDLRASVTVDRDGIIRQWGDAVTEVVGYSAADTVGQSLNVVIPPALRPLHWRGFDQAMKTGSAAVQDPRCVQGRPDSRCPRND